MGSKKERERRSNRNFPTCVCVSFVLILPHPAPRAPGSVVDNTQEPGQTSVRTRCRRVVTQKGKGWERAQSQEPSRPGRWSFVGVGGGRFSLGGFVYVCVLLLFVDGRFLCGMWSACIR